METFVVSSKSIEGVPWDTPIRSVDGTGYMADVKLPEYIYTPQIHSSDDSGKTIITRELKRTFMAKGNCTYDQAEAMMNAQRYANRVMARFLAWKGYKP